jgi:hypothetical protein
MRYTVCNGKSFHNPDRIASPQYGSDIMRIEDIFEYDGEIRLAIVQHLIYPFFPFWGHEGIVYDSKV